MKIRLSDHFTAGRLLRFTFPTILMMLFTSIYGVIDGIFVSNFVGKTAFASINLIFPVVSILACPCFMLAAGGTALVGRTLGEGDRKRANEYFSLVVYTTFAVGIALSAAGLIILRPLAVLLGAKGEMLENCLLYGGILIATQTLFMLQVIFQFFLIAAEKPHLNLGFTLASGLTNIVLDFLFVGILRWGLAGAAFATAISQLVGVIPMLYFAFPNGSLLRLTKAPLDLAALAQTCTNGVSELMGNISASIVTVLYNFQLLRLAGEDGIAAYGVIMYVMFIFQAIYIGYGFGASPIISYHFGAKNTGELKNLLAKSVRILTLTGIVLTLSAELFAGTLADIFVGYDAALAALTTRGLRLYALSFLINCYNYFGSAFFTALNDGFVSAVISFMRTFVFQMLSILILPFVLGTDGIWLAIVFAESFALCVTVYFLRKKKDVYHYL